MPRVSRSRSLSRVAAFVCGTLGIGVGFAYEPVLIQRREVPEIVQAIENTKQTLDTEDSPAQVHDKSFTACVEQPAIAEPSAELEARSTDGRLQMPAMPDLASSVERNDEPPSTAAEALTLAFKRAALAASNEQSVAARGSHARRKYLSVNTRECNYAAYMEAWRAKVERVGNLNYPDEARQLSGTLLLDVTLTPDGAVHDIKVLRSSGHPVLDATAVRTVELAAPFTPFPDDIRREVDELHIVRTWKFMEPVPTSVP